MTALARTGKSEAFAERRVALGVLSTLSAPVAVSYTHLTLPTTPYV